MASYTLDISPSPSLSAYDPDNPTQATEELNLALHNMLVAMESAGWKMSDDIPATSDIEGALYYCFGIISGVFDYADQAITNFRAKDPTGLSEPLITTITVPTPSVYPELTRLMMEHWLLGIKALYFIYYLWETEDDPLRVKDFIRDMLIAWPLLDTTIELRDEGGSALRVFPQWRNLET
jgi:hypothetical protein